MSTCTYITIIPITVLTSLLTLKHIFLLSLQRLNYCTCASFVLQTGINCQLILWRNSSSVMFRQTSRIWNIRKQCRLSVAVARNTERLPLWILCVKFPKSAQKSVTRKVTDHAITCLGKVESPSVVLMSRRAKYRMDKTPGGGTPIWNWRGFSSEN